MTDPLTAPDKKPLQSLVELDSRHRLVVPKDICDRMGWAKSGAPVNVIVVLDEPGTARLLSADEWQERMEERRKQFANAGDEEALLLLDERYKFFQLGSERRFMLSDEILMHLCVIEKAPIRLYVEYYNSAVRITTADYRAKRMAKMAHYFDGLP